MATRTEMITRLKADHPRMCEHQDIDNLPDEAGVTGRTTVTKLYIEYGYSADTWASCTASERRNVDSAIGSVLSVDSSYEFDLRTMKKGWVRSGKVAISSAGVVSYNGNPFTKDKALMCDRTSISRGLKEALNLS